jgi:hypothetical protein
MICAVGVDFYILPVVGGLEHNHETFSTQLVSCIYDQGRDKPVMEAATLYFVTAPNLATGEVVLSSLPVSISTALAER